MTTKRNTGNFICRQRSRLLFRCRRCALLPVRGQGDPNEEGGEYQQALNLLYALAYTVKMSKMGAHQDGGVL